MFFDRQSGGGVREMRLFTWLVLAVQLLGVVAVVLTAVWMGHFRGGFAWQSDPSHQFNYHPLFMIIGMVFLQADAILAYRVFRNDRKVTIKVLHAAMHIAALVFASVGLKAVFDSHNLATPKPLPNLYSLHSWIGLFIVICFGCQWVMGFASFLFPKFGMAMRTTYLSVHTVWGVGILVLSSVNSLIGITEKALFSIKDTYPSLPAEAYLLNSLGLVIVVFTALVVYLVTKPEYKRPPAPEEDHVPLDS